MDSFARFIPDGIDLDARAIRAAGLAAAPFPAWASPDEVAAVGGLVGADRAELWGCQYQQEPLHLTGLSLDEAGRQSFDLGYETVLVAFEAVQTFIWQPLEHEFFVIFAPQPALDAIRSAGIFIYDFDDYAHEPYFKGKRSDYLVGIGRRYTIMDQNRQGEASMMLADFPITIEYAQVVVQTEGHGAAGLLWTDAHVAQGFAWSDGLVSFGVPDHDGQSRIEVELAPAGAFDPQSLWAVQVPFDVDGPLQVGTLFDTRRVVVPNGRYDLVYQAFPGTNDHAYTLRLTFSHSDASTFRILKQGGDITADAVLRSDAEPAK